MVINANSKKIRIILAPLDWGLGHTTRCIPIIRALINREIEVVLAGNEVQKQIILSEFPQCHFLYLKGYDIRYSQRKILLPFKLLIQIPKILSVVKRENSWLKMIVKKFRIDGVISDNRFGLFHKELPSCFITHQLQIQTRMGSVANKLVRKLNYYIINKFSQCWIPDFEGDENLAGILAHPPKLPDTTCIYLGGLSRINSCASDCSKDGLLILISGPEPQRSLFEKKIFDQVCLIDDKITIIRGLPGESDVPNLGTNVIVFNHLSAEEMNVEFAKATYIICRSGYSSVMDINAVKAHSILIPTPGQTEQEYLAQYLMNKHFAICENQANFDLPKLLEKASSFSYDGFIQNREQYLSKAIDGFLKKCINNRDAIL